MKPTKPNKLQMLKPQVRMAGTPKVNVLGVGARVKGEGATARGYNYKWQKARERFLSEHPLCHYCERTGRITAASVVDHKIPHQGDAALFWNESNWQLPGVHWPMKQRRGRGAFQVQKNEVFETPQFLIRRIFSLYSN